MADDPPASARIRRVDDRLGLAVCRVPLSGRSLVTYARDHVTVRTPSHPGLADGNTLDLGKRPAPAALSGWVDRFRDTIGQLGASTVQLRWEEPVTSSTSDDVPQADPGLDEAARGLGLVIAPVTVLLLGDLADPGTPDDAIPLTADDDAATERRWHASGVLYRYAEGDTPADFHAAARDPAGTIRDRIEIERELVRAGRARTWIMMRHGGPAGRLTLVHDRQGLAAVSDVVVHPAHRRRGVAAGLAHRALRDHLGRTGDRVGVAVVPGSPADRLFHRLGFRPHATVWRARGDVRRERRQR